MDGKVARNDELPGTGGLHGSRFEGEHGKLGSVEVIRTTKIVVAHGDPSINRGSIDSYVHRPSCGARRIKLGRAAYLCERSSHRGKCPYGGRKTGRRYGSGLSSRFG